MDVKLVSFLKAKNINNGTSESITKRTGFKGEYIYSPRAAYELSAAYSNTDTLNIVAKRYNLFLSFL